MKKIPLCNSKGQIRDYALVDDSDFERVSKLKWHLIAKKLYGEFACLNFPMRFSRK